MNNTTRDPEVHWQVEKLFYSGLKRSLNPGTDMKESMSVHIVYLAVKVKMTVFK